MVVCGGNVRVMKTKKKDVFFRAGQIGYAFGIETPNGMKSLKGRDRRCSLNFTDGTSLAESGHI